MDCLCACLPLRHHFQGSCYLPSASWTLEQQEYKTTGSDTQTTWGEHRFKCALIHKQTRYYTFLPHTFPQQPTSMSPVISKSLFDSQTHKCNLSRVWAATAWANLPPLTGLPTHPPGWMLSLSSGTEWLFALWTQLADVGNLIIQTGLAKKSYFQEPMHPPTSIAATSRRLL